MANPILRISEIYQPVFQKRYLVYENGLLIYNKFHFHESEFYKAFDFEPNKHVLNVVKPTETDLWGGRGRGGSYMLSLLAVFFLVTQNKFHAFFVRLFHSSIHDSIWLEFINRVNELGLEDSFKITHKPMVATYIPNGNTIKAKGMRASTKSATATAKSLAEASALFFEEFDEIPKTDYLKIKDSLRTARTETLQIFRAFNATDKSHWIISDYYNLIPTQYEGYFQAVSKGNPKHLSIFSDFKDNEANINKDVRLSFENYKETNIDHYLKDIKGYISSGAKGLVYKDFQSYETLPTNIQFEKILGFDLGGTDQYALVTIYINKELKVAYWKLNLYKDHLVLDDLRTAVMTYSIDKVNGKTFSRNVVMDNNNDIIYLELANLPISLIKTKKGSGSVENGIDIVKSYKNFVHVNDSEIWQDLSEYRKKICPVTGNIINEYLGRRHSLDAGRYAIVYYSYNY